jgi:hypothetical protein
MRLPPVWSVTAIHATNEDRGFRWSTGYFGTLGRVNCSNMPYRDREPHGKRGINGPTETACDPEQTMPLTHLAGIDILRRDPLQRLPGCWYLKDSRMLRDLDDRTVEAMARGSSTATYAVGEFLHEAGEPMSAMTFINRGRVKVYRVSRDGKQQTIVLLGPGDAFGEIGMVDLGPRTCTSRRSRRRLSAGPSGTPSSSSQAAMPRSRSGSRRRWARSSRRPVNGSPTLLFATCAAGSPI